MSERVFGPISDAARRVAGDVEGPPAAGDGAGEFAAVARRREERIGERGAGD
jgi:hypothetical protein